MVSSLADEAEYVGQVFEIGRSSNISWSTMASDVSLRGVFEGGVAAFFNAAFNEWDASDGFLTVWKALSVAAICRPSRNVGPRLLTVVP